jgi:two-component system phosphate regulon sensor histidine kinase PhoR
MIQRAQQLVSRLLASAADVVHANAPASSTAASTPPAPPPASAQSIVDALPDAAIVLDPTALILTANGAAHEIFGRILVGDHVGRTARHPELSDAIKTTLSTGQKSSFFLALQSPSERHLDGSAARLSGLGDGPGAPAVLVVLQDISEREALARMRVEFVANASHELRTPLAALSGFIETLKGPAKNDPKAREKFLGVMAEQAQRMTRLIDDLLLLSRVEMKAHIAPTSMADLVLVATEAIKLVSAAAQRYETTIVSEFKQQPATLIGDHDELVQAVQNLLSNAIKYGHSKGRVVVRVERQEDRRAGTVLRLSVADDGPGIAAEHLPRLTERFYRVNTSASREKGGTGLGLAIVKHIAVRHRGRVEVTSRQGVGTTFSLVFPLNDGR